MALHMTTTLPNSHFVDRCTNAELGPSHKQIHVLSILVQLCIFPYFFVCYIFSLQDMMRAERMCDRRQLHMQASSCLPLQKARHIGIENEDRHLMYMRLTLWRDEAMWVRGLDSPGLMYNIGCFFLCCMGCICWPKK